MDQSSPFSPYLSTNYVPTDAETHLLHHLIAARKAKADALTSKTGNTKSSEAVTSIEVERAAHLKFAADHARLLSPIRRVPHEVLSIVFEHCRDQMDESRFTGYNVSKPPQHVSIVLSHVCQGWRYLALDTPALWNRIHVSIPGIRTVCGFAVGYRGWCRKLEYVRDMVAVWMKRSSRRPIRLNLQNSENQPGAFQGQFQAVALEQYRVLVEAICETSFKWQDVEFTFYLDPITRPLVNLLDRQPQEFPILRSLQASIQCNQSDGCETTNACLQTVTSSGLLAAPRLRSVSIGGLWGDIQTAKAISTFPIWETVTHFTLHAKVSRVSNGSEAALQMLKSLQNLSECNLGLAQEYWHHISTQSTRIRLPNLTRLSFSGFPPARGFASCLDLPSLQRLDFNYAGVDWPYLPIAENVDGTLEFLQLFGQQLRVATLYPHSIVTKSLRHYLQLLPNVTSLKIHGADPRKSISSAMPIINACLHFTACPIVCPRLESLMVSIHATPEQISVEKALAEAVAYRRRSGRAGVARLRRVRVLFGARKPEFDVRRELAKRGVDLDGCELVIQYSHHLRLLV